MEDNNQIEHAGPALSTVKPQKKEALSNEETIHFENVISNIDPFSKEVILSNLKNPYKGVFYIDDVLTQEECQSLRDSIDASSNLTFWCSGKENDTSVKSFRNAFTIELFSSIFAEKIWSRIKDVLTPMLELEIEDNQEHEDYEREIVGKWVPCYMNPDNLFVRYPSGGSFAPHTDGRAIIDFNRRSHYTIVLYLNSVPLEQGAGTRFYDNKAVNMLEKKTINNTEIWTSDKSLVTYEAEAKAGRMVIFHQALVHEGVPPVDPYLKYIIRSDIIFVRDPLICDSDSDKEAYRLFRQAEDLAENGDVKQSVALFKKAFKLSPEMARLMGQA